MRVLAHRDESMLRELIDDARRIQAATRDARDGELLAYLDGLVSDLVRFERRTREHRPLDGTSGCESYAMRVDVEADEVNERFVTQVYERGDVVNVDVTELVIGHDTAQAYDIVQEIVDEYPPDEARRDRNADNKLEHEREHFYDRWR